MKYFIIFSLITMANSSPVFSSNKSFTNAKTWDFRSCLKLKYDESEVQNRIFSKVANNPDNFKAIDENYPAKSCISENDSKIEITNDSVSKKVRNSKIPDNSLFPGIWLTECKDTSDGDKLSSMTQN